MGSTPGFVGFVAWVRRWVHRWVRVVSALISCLCLGLCFCCFFGCREIFLLQRGEGFVDFF